jgi:hypothetical protein
VISRLGEFGLIGDRRGRVGLESGYGLHIFLQPLDPQPIKDEGSGQQAGTDEGVPGNPNQTHPGIGGGRKPEQVQPVGKEDIDQDEQGHGGHEGAHQAPAGDERIQGCLLEYKDAVAAEI